jgi:hypothetical protein
LTISFEPTSGFLDHYYHFWSSRAAPEVILNEQDRILKTNLVIEHINEACKLLATAGLPTDQYSSFIFQGRGAANGHAYVDAAGNAYPWFAIECFDSELKARVFVMHEIVHALHYSLVPEFYFASHFEKDLVWRQLITEGIATYVTRELLGIRDGEALWADALPGHDLARWMTDCQAAEAEIAKRILSTLNSSDHSSSLFHAADPTDIYSYRAGYFLGLRIIDDIAKEDKAQIRDLLGVPAIALRHRAQKVLEKLAN